MEISPRFGRAGTIAPSRVQTPVRFGNFTAQSLPELGMATKLVVPIMIGGLVYSIHRQFNKISAGLGETLALMEKNQELNARGKTKQLIWNVVNTGGWITALGTAGTSLYKLLPLKKHVNENLDPLLRGAAKSFGELDTWKKGIEPTIEEVSKYSKPIKLLEEYMAKPTNKGVWHELQYALFHAGFIPDPKLP